MATGDARKVADEGGTVHESGQLKPGEHTRPAVTVTGSAQAPSTQPWAANPNGVVRRIDQVADLARRHGVEIPDDIRFVAVKAEWLDPDTFAQYFSRTFRAGERISWEVFYTRFDDIAVKLSRDILGSDEAIVAIVSHEMHELNGLRAIFAERDTITAEELFRLINPGRKGNLHDQAWDVADDLVRAMRGRGGK